MKLSKREDIITFLKEYLEDKFEIIYKHSLAVEKLALYIHDQIKEGDRFVIMAGSLLHDIGRKNYPPSKPNSILHGLEGYRILKELGVDERIAKIARNHIGVGITKEDIIEQKLPLPLDNYVPETIEEIVVAYADNRVNYDVIEDVWFPIKRFYKEIGPKYALKMVEMHNFLISKGFTKDFNGKQLHLITQQEFYENNYLTV